MACKHDSAQTLFTLSLQTDQRLGEGNLHPSVTGKCTESVTKYPGNLGGYDVEKAGG